MLDGSSAVQTKVKKNDDSIRARRQCFQGSRDEDRVA